MSACSADDAKGLARPNSRAMQALAYGFLNISTTVGIVFVNKLIMGHYDFKYPVALTWIHTVFTAIGMEVLCRLGVFKRSNLSTGRTVPLSAMYAAYIVASNLSLKYNTVGFYQILKIAITPVVVAIEAAFYSKLPSRSALVAVAILCIGVTLATVSDQDVTSNSLGMIVGGIATVTSALYGIWAGAKQREYGVDGMQLLHACSPAAALLLGIFVPLLEPVGWSSPGDPDTLLGYWYSSEVVALILLSAAMGLLVTLSVFLFIGASSPLTYSVVGHLKTVFIMAGGYFFFGDQLGAVKLAGLALAMTGIISYSNAQMKR